MNQRLDLAIAAPRCSTGVVATDDPIGKPAARNGMEIAAFLQAVTMEPQGRMAQPTQSDIHADADYHAIARDSNGIVDRDNVAPMWPGRYDVGSCCFAPSRVDDAFVLAGLGGKGGN